MLVVNKQKMGTKNAFGELTKDLVGRDWMVWGYKDIKVTVVVLRLSCNQRELYILV